MTESLWPIRHASPTRRRSRRELTDAVLDRLLAVPPGLEARVYEAMRYAALAPGKRLRPFLVMASARLFGVAPAQRAAGRRGDRDGARLFAGP